MKRVVLLGPVLALCAALIVGCSSGDSGSATPSSSAAAPTMPSGSAGSSVPTEPRGSQLSSGAASSGAGSSSSAVAGGSAVTPTGDATALDAPTAVWFDTFCTGLAPLATLDLSDQVNSGPTDAPDPADPDNSIQKQTLVSALTEAAAAFGQTSQALAAQEPPTFDGGAEFAAAAAAGLGTAGGQVQAAVTAFDAVPAGATDEYWTAKDTLRTQSLAALAPLQTLAEPPAEVSSGVSQIPSCQALGL